MKGMEDMKFLLDSKPKETVEELIKVFLQESKNKEIIAEPPVPPKADLDKSVALNLYEAILNNATDIQEPVKKEQAKSDNKLRPQNYKTVPCKMYHSATASCNRGEFCHFIHDPKYIGRDIPQDIWKPKKRPAQELVPPPFPMMMPRMPFPYPFMPGSIGRPPMPMYNFPPGCMPVPYPYMPRMKPPEPQH